MKKLALLFLIVMGGCSGLVIDPSMSALDARDLTLAMSACEATPGRGLDVCRVTEGDTIASAWTMIVPKGMGVQGGEVNVFYRDIHKTYGVSGNTVVVPWREFFNSDKWTADMDGEAMALVFIRYKDETGLEHVAKFRGLAKIIVTKPGYERLPIDSGFAAWGTTCKIQYTTAGRGAIKCR